MSISSNIAEGCGRGSHRELSRFLQIASGSAHELESQVLVAEDLGFCVGVSETDVSNEITQVKSMLAKLQSVIRSSIE